ncbi:hypothetical protein JAAARDRAFT_79794 [Jaapia argillacea MUCL 33604]|uniref:Uncharacterized protein n=1 Tax=Jaapia argillacea MUCL 33604 TaxID=933084 RepID=A0A067PK66_9AGAM|nr:hypothetical protein JAAARDRAFT_79794 [Jaapia argillacea MUCL 33604]
MVDVVATIISILSLLATLVVSGVGSWAVFYRDDRHHAREAEAIREKYAAPLLLAAQELQAKLRRFVRDGDICTWIGEHAARREYLLRYTCFVTGEFLAWIHILRHEVQYLRFSTDRQNRNLTNILGDIRETLRGHSSHSDYIPCVLYTGEQRAIGELMTVEENGRRVCIGYAAFCQMWKDNEALRGWFERFLKDLVDLAEARTNGNGKAVVKDDRLRIVQHLLVDLIEELDPKGLSSTIA